MHTQVKFCWDFHNIFRIIKDLNYCIYNVLKILFFHQKMLLGKVSKCVSYTLLVKEATIFLFTGHWVLL